MPILLASVFGAVFHRPAGGEPMRLPLLVVAEDDGPLTRRVVADLLACDKLDAAETDRASAMKTDRRTRLRRGGGAAGRLRPRRVARPANPRRPSSCCTIRPARSKAAGRRASSPKS